MWNVAWCWREEGTGHRSGAYTRDSGYGFSTSERPFPAGHSGQTLPSARFLGGLRSGLLKFPSGHRAGGSPLSLCRAKLLTEAQLSGCLSAGHKKGLCEKRLTWRQSPLRTVLPRREPKPGQGTGGEHAVLPAVLEIDHVPVLDGFRRPSPELGQFVPHAFPATASRRASPIPQPWSGRVGSREAFSGEAFLSGIHDPHHLPNEGPTQSSEFFLTVQYLKV